jgi:hypothetical protein
VKRVKISSPDVRNLSIAFLNNVTYSLRQYVGWDSKDAVKHYLARISARIPQFQTMEEPELNFIKVCDSFS